MIKTVLVAFCVAVVIGTAAIALLDRRQPIVLPETMMPVKHAPVSNM